MKMKTLFVRHLFVTSLAMGLAACGSSGNPAAPSSPSGGGSTPTTPTPTPPANALERVTLSANLAALDRTGATAQVTATGTMSNGTTQNVTSSCSDWRSDNESVATVNSNGLISARNSGSASITTRCQGVFANSLITLTLGPRTSFSSGQYLVGSDIAGGRYFSDPVSGCYWERQSGLGGSLGEIIANEFIGFNAGQWIVDILSGDRAFETDSDCGTWNTSPRGGLQSEIRPGMWLVGSQIAPGRYRTQASSGCYWERMRHFQGTLSGVIDNEFVSSAGQQIVEIRSSDVGFQSDADCGTWTRVSSISSPSHDESSHQSSPSEIEMNWQSHRSRNGVR